MGSTPPRPFASGAFSTTSRWHMVYLFPDPFPFRTLKTMRAAVECKQL
jgi:hypothetical protein